MRSRAGIIGAALMGVALTAHAQTSPYASMAVAGTHNGWATTPNMTLAANNIWVTTQTFSSASGQFKFAANGSWTTNWGGGASIARVPAVANASVAGGGDLNYAGLSNGFYRVIFNDSTREFRMEWAGAAPLPLPAYTNMSLVGDFNGWTPSPGSMLTNSPANTNRWSCSVELESETAFQFYPNGSYSNQYGAPENGLVLSVPVTDASACGKADFTLSNFEPGTFQFTLDTSNATFAIQQTSTQSFSAMTVQGDFIATNNPPPNMMRLGSTTLWESDHYITNSGPVTVRFSGNNGARKWGATNGTPAFSLPVSGTLTSAQTNFATVSSLAPGRYRITFDHVTGAFTFRLVYDDPSGLNLLKNPGFELTTDSSGGDAVDWGSWQAWPKNVPNHQFSPHSGSWCGSIEGKWYPERTDYGSFAQDALVESGKTYRASAWFKATPDWTASSMQVKIEWQATNGPVGDEAIANIVSLTTNWVKYSVEAAAPDGATQAHVVFLCAGAGTVGSMHVDDAELRAVAGRTQNFDTWGSLTNFDAFAPDWSITSGRTVNNVPPGRPPASVFISQYVEGTGNNKAIEIYNGTLSNLDFSAETYVLQQYDNGSLTASVSIALSGSLASSGTRVVGRPNFPTNYGPDLAIRGLPNLATNKLLTFNGDDVVVLRKGGATGTVMDRVGQVGTNATGSIWSRNTKNRTLSRKQTVFTGTVGQVTAAFPLEEWNLRANDDFSGLGSHDISYLDPNEPYTPAGLSLIMDSGATLMSGDLPGGIGDVSFWYRTESMSPPVTMEIETAASDSGPWTSAATLANIAASNFAYYVVAINRADHLYVRIRQTDGGANRFRIDEITVTESATIKRLEDFNGWTDPSYAIPGDYSRYGWSLQNASIATGGVLGTRAALLSQSAAAVASPGFEGGVGEVRFWAKANESGTTTDLRLETTVDGSNWVPQATFSATTGKTFSTWLYLTDIGAQARLILDADSTEALVDNVEVRLPALYRNQNFDGWPTRGSYTNDTYQGWSLTACIVDSQNAYQGQVARLNTTLGNYVQSPEFPDGIGTISFRTRKWGNDDTAFTLQVQLSSNGTSWATLASVSATSTNYQQFTYFLQDTSNRFVRLYHSAAASRVLIDDIRIGEPQPRPQVIVTPGLDPANPLINDPMTIAADVVTRYGASVLSVTGYYAIGSTTNALPMAPADFGSYASVSDIPGQAAGTQIRYWVHAQYAGIGAATNSSVYSTNVALSAIYTNYVSTLPLGRVWINEIFYAPYLDEPYNEEYTELIGQNHEYIELCGVADSDISGWKIELAFGSDPDITANGNQPIYAAYTIPTNTVFTNQTNGFSFYVLGDQPLTSNHPIDKLLTTLVPTNVTKYPLSYKDHVHDGVGVVRLLNQFGHVVYSLSYGGYASGSERIPSQVSFGEYNSVGLSGSNFTYVAFDWGKSNLTIGAVNEGQILVEPPPDTNVYAYAWHTQALKITPLNTNDVPVFFMFDPEGAGHFSTNDIYYGYTNSAYDNPGGTLYHRRGGIGAGWTPLDMGIRAGSTDAGGHTYVFGRIPDHTYKRLQTIEYVIEVDPNESGVEKIYLGSDAGGDNLSTVYTNFAEAAENPFTYAIPIADQILVTNFVIGATNVLLQTEGNDFKDPVTNFYVKFTTNLMLPTSQWINTNFTQTMNIYSQNTFNLRKATNALSNVFYRVDPRWP